MVSSYNADPVLLSRLWTFTAEEDLTLRQVHFSSDTSAVLSTDPSFTMPPPGQPSNEFQLNAAVSPNWENLAFPVPKGTRLYWAVSSLAGNGQLITLVFS